MQFLTFDQAQREPFTEQYRHSPVTSLIALLVVLLLMGASGFPAYMAWLEGSILGMVIMGWIELWAGFFAYLMGRALRRRLRPSNWVVRMHANGISIKFRSYLNHHLDPKDPTVVFIQYSEIEYARDRRIRQEVPQDEGTETRFLRFAEFKLHDDDDLARLDQQLSAEQARQAPMRGKWVRHRSKDGDYPVCVADGFLRIQWWVFPRLPQFMKDLSSRVDVREQVKSREDFTSQAMKTV